MKRDELLTPDEAALRLKVTAEQVRSLIRKGELAAINIGARKKRPLYRIRTDALEEFLHDRTHVPERTSRPRFKRLPPVADYFPDLH